MTLRQPQTQKQQRLSRQTPVNGTLPHWVRDRYFAYGRAVPRVGPKLGARDAVGAWKVRWGISRMDYRVPDGLYAIGKPTRESEILVTANYKLSFDALRKELAGVDAWILVLDTKGVNVWCAAGKGTFGTKELARQVRRCDLAGLVSHRRLVLPQLGATGVSAHLAEESTGFRVVWGPVRASDVPRFLRGGMAKDERMRAVEFPLRDRMAVAPLELAHAWPLLLASCAVSLAAGFLPGPTRGHAGEFLAAFAGSVLAGTLLFPALLPVLPFRAFALKGAALGLAWNAALALAFRPSPAWAAALALATAPAVAYGALNFTGSSTYTNLSGARREVAVGVPLMIASCALGLALAAVLAVRGVAL